MNAESLRRIPSMTALLALADVGELVERRGAGVVKLELRSILDNVRADLERGGRADAPTAEEVAAELSACMARTEPSGRRAINATGILLHTGLGRAPLSDYATRAVAASSGYTTLQADPASGERSLREERVERYLREITGCEAATVVNNNAAATFLCLNALAAGREVVVSRGQLIEIGGSFRMPDVMAMSGCRLREVGTTNRTHLRDYEAAIGPDTAALLHVHTSNYRVRGFSGTPSALELAGLARERGLASMDDLGSGALVPLAEYGLPDEPLVADSVRAGVDLACFSGDKLISGPQSGIIVGRAEWVGQIRKNHFARMFRVSKHTLAGLEATLEHFLDDSYRTRIPFYRMLGRKLTELDEQARRLVEAVSGSLLELEIGRDLAYIGSGSAPDEGVPSVVVRAKTEDAEGLARRLRLGSPPVFPRVAGGAVTLDMRTVEPADIEALAERLRGAVR